jgi:hypothetical protein
VCWRAPEGSVGGPEGSQKRSGPGKGCESKGRCSLFLRKRKKIRKKNQRGPEVRWGPQEPSGAKKGALLSPRGAQVGQENITISNCCTKERKEERKMRGPKGTWKGPYLGPKGALGAPPRVTQGALSVYLGASIRALSRPNCKPSVVH